MIADVGPVEPGDDQPLRGDAELRQDVGTRVIGRPGPGAAACAVAPGVSMLRYFLRRAPERLAALKEIPARIAFCWTAAAVRPSFLAT